MARPRKPTALRIIEGNAARRPLPENEPKPELGAVAPKWLSPLAAEHWSLVSEQLEEVGVLTRMDQTALALYCEAFARYKDATEHVTKFGTIVKSPSGYPMQSPYLAIASKAHEQMVKLLVEFGMTPAARSKVEVAGNGKKSKPSKTGLGKYI